MNYSLEKISRESSLPALSHPLVRSGRCVPSHHSPISVGIGGSYSIAKVGGHLWGQKAAWSQNKIGQ